MHTDGISHCGHWDTIRECQIMVTTETESISCLKLMCWGSLYFGPLWRVLRNLSLATIARSPVITRPIGLWLKGDDEQEQVGSVKRGSSILRCWSVLRWLKFLDAMVEVYVYEIIGAAWLRLRQEETGYRRITFTELFPGLERFPILSILPLHPYRVTVPSSLIQYSSRFLRWGLLSTGLLEVKQMQQFYLIRPLAVYYLSFFFMVNLL